MASCTSIFPGVFDVILERAYKKHHNSECHKTQTKLLCVAILIIYYRPPVDIWRQHFGPQKTLLKTVAVLFFLSKVMETAMGASNADVNKALAGLGCIHTTVFFAHVGCIYFLKQMQIPEKYRKHIVILQ